jgi:hypothetical protein
MEKWLKAIAVKWAFQFRCDFLLDSETEEGLLIRREADAIGRDPALCFGYMFCSLKSLFERSAQHL